ncbi:MAG: alkaline phosphatase family protein, partial [Bryobacteraceae bacterium]
MPDRPRVLFLVFACCLALQPACGIRRSHANEKKLIVLGIDGADPGFIERHWNDLPNFASLRDNGSFHRLQTTSPPQSPVAWSTFIT